LCFFGISQIAQIEHFTLVSHHLVDTDRVLFAVFGSIVIDATNIFFLVWQFPQPGTSQHLLTRHRAYPNFFIADILENIRAVVLPPIDFTGSRRETAAVTGATLATLVAVFHGGDEIPDAETNKPD